MTSYDEAKSYLKQQLSDYLCSHYDIKDMKAFCSPFREDKQPSCNMLPDGTAFYDHGTDETIDIFKAIMKEEGCDYKTAFSIACNIFHVSVDDNSLAGTYTVKPVDSKYQTEKLRKDRINEALSAVCNDANTLQHYLSRGFTRETIQRFKLGYSRPGFNYVVADSKHAISEKRSKYYPYIIPFLDGTEIPFLMGEVCSRSQTNEDGKPLSKYVKPYDMKQPLYNECLLKNIKTPFFVTEGIYDCLSIIQQGGQAVALVGTAFTCLKDALSKYHIPKTAVIIISTDNDTAGIAAGKEIHKYLDENGYPCIVYHFDGAKDCNELLMKNPDSLHDQITSAIGKAYQLFHRMDKVCLQPIDTIDEYIANHIIKSNDMFLRNGKLYLYADGYYQVDEDGTRFKSMISEYIVPYLITERRVSRVHALLLTKYSLKINDTDVNLFPDHWIPFENGFLDLCGMQLFPLDAKYRCIYQIPHRWDNQAISNDSITERYLKSFFETDEDLELFLQFSAVCMTKDMHFQRMMILRGNGGLGKSVLLNNLTKLIGSRNTSTVSMQRLNERFQTIPLIDKVLNIYSDLDSSDMAKTDVIKLIVGQDAIPAEYKGGQSFSFKPICKLMFSANKIPKSRDEKTDAMYRRLLIIPFTHQGIYVEQIEKQLETDLDSFMAMVINAGHRLYTTGKLAISKNSIKEVSQLHYDTDTVYAFLNDKCIVTHDIADRIERINLYENYKNYCIHEDRQQGQLSNNGFYQNLREKGFDTDHKSNGCRWIVGIRWKD